jgi:multicomponent Na+:H+ antiporter subunit B
MIWQLDLLFFVIIVVMAVLALRVRNLLAAVAIFSAFSLVVAVMFAGMAAVDVAFVEAVIGTGLTGVLFVILIRSTSSRATELDRKRPLVVLLPLIGAFVGLMLYASGGLPDRGDPEGPAHQYLAPDYLTGALADSRTPNVVTAILADYRSIDTLGEVLVIFTAGLAVMSILHRREPAAEVAGSTDGDREESPDGR